MYLLKLYLLDVCNIVFTTSNGVFNSEKHIPPMHPDTNRSKCQHLFKLSVSQQNLISILLSSFVTLLRCIWINLITFPLTPKNTEFTTPVLKIGNIIPLKYPVNYNIILFKISMSMYRTVNGYKQIDLEDQNH